MCTLPVAAVSNGWNQLIVENEHLALTLIPARGGEIHSILDKALDSDLLWHPTWPTPAGPAVADGAAFHDWYLGGWQSLLPNGGGPCVVDGVSHEQHGDAWHQHAQITSGPTDLSIALASTTLPLRVTRRLRLRGRTVVLDETVKNEGDHQILFMWGHHPALGGVLIEEGTKVDLPGARTLSYGPVDTHGRIAPGGSGQWPHITARGGGELDLSIIPGPDVRSHDVALLTDLEAGWFAVRNPRRNIGVAFSFPAEVFRWLWMWQRFGSAAGEPSAHGAYCLALEPWTSPPGLDNATATGTALALEAGEMISATLSMTVFEASEIGVSDVAADGTVAVG